MGKRINIWLFCVIIIAQCIVIVFWGTQKERMHVDEMFTMEGAKQSGYSMRYWDLDEDYYGSEHTSQEFWGRLTVNEDDLILRNGISEAGKALAERNFYYTILNLVSTSWPGQVPWILGVGLNLLFFIISQFFLYLITKVLIGDSGALITVLIYGFSAGAISTVLYVRCYMMLTMYALSLFYIYIRFFNEAMVWKKILCIFLFEILAVLCYRTHQFGTILFAVITFLFILYVLYKKDKRSILWMLIGYGIPCLAGWKIILNKLIAFFSMGVAPLYYNSVKRLTWLTLKKRVISLTCTVAEHLAVNIWVFLFGLVVIMLLFLCKHQKREQAGPREESKRTDQELGILVIGFVGIYYCIMITGDAVPWRYLSLAYPFVVLGMVWCINRLFPNLSGERYGRIVMAIVFLCITAVSYNAGHISELYSGEEAMREELEEKYHGINGIMVHHDFQGIGENWLYEAATLWPQESHVLVIHNKSLRERELNYIREDDKILLWLTVDYDREEAMEWFLECTEYTTIEPVLHTENIWVYECRK